MPTPAFRTEVPSHPVDLILGRPSPHGVTVSVLSYADSEGFIAYWVRSGDSPRETPHVELPAGQPVEISIGPLPENTPCHYQLRSRSRGVGPFLPGPEYGFRTARPRGESFIFTLQADSHLDYGTDLEVYRASLANVAASSPDFHMDLGDTFMTDKYTDHTQALPQYIAQRYWLGLVGARTPLFLVLGNHDGEQPGRGASGAGSMPVWANTMRKRYFPNPVPDPFYSGNARPDPHAGLLQDYYAFEWGEALFVVLDPFWYSARPRGGAGGASFDNWGRTLGEDQYRWLGHTLAASSARFKFIFVHHLVGGESREGRGGVEASRYFEWGGANGDGSNGFSEHRPGWAEPIHQLLVRHHVSAVFHGHDHFYARQERDGVVYQLVPQPGHARVDNLPRTADYGYLSGTFEGASGILRVSVTPSVCTVDYVRAYPAAPVRGDRANGTVTQRYQIAPPAHP